MCEPIMGAARAGMASSGMDMVSMRWVWPRMVDRKCLH